RASVMVRGMVFSVLGWPEGRVAAAFEAVCVPGGGGSVVDDEDVELLTLVEVLVHVVVDGDEVTLGPEVPVSVGRVVLNADGRLAGVHAEVAGDDLGDEDDGAGVVVEHGMVEAAAEAHGTDA